MLNKTLASLQIILHRLNLWNMAWQVQTATPTLCCYIDISIRRHRRVRDKSKARNKGIKTQGTHSGDQLTDRKVAWMVYQHQRRYPQVLYCPRSVSHA